MEQIIREYRPDVKDSTIGAYVRSLTKLNGLLGENPEYTPDKVLPVIESLHYTTQRNILNSLIVYLKATDNPPSKIKSFIEKRDKHNTQYKEEQMSGKISEKQKPNFVSLDSVREMLEKIKPEIDVIKKMPKAGITLNRANRNLFSAYTLFQFYITAPLRNDFAMMEMTTRRAYNKLSLDEKRHKNYMLFEKNKINLMLNNYKTAGTYGEKTIPMDKKVERLMRNFVKVLGYKTGDVVFPYSSNTLTQLLIRTSKKYINKKIGTTMLRHIYLSDKYGESKLESQADAEKMGHSVKTQQDVYVKDPNDFQPIEEDHLENDPPLPDFILADDSPEIV